MGKLKRLSVALVLFLGFLTLSSAEKPREQRYFAEVSVRRVLVALEKAAMFYSQDRFDLNLDAYFGLRIAQGSLHELTSKKRSVKALLKYGILKQTKRINKVVSEITATSTEVLINSTPGYYYLVGPAVTQPWRALNGYRRIDQNLIEPFNKTRLLDDILQLYEPCLARLLGSPRYGSKPCDISDQCWKVMVRPGEIGYVLTHQALYLMLGEEKGCIQKFSRNLKQENRSLESVYDKICSNIYAQLLLVERIKPKTRGNADLLMEQSVVCGLLGYYQFLTPQRLKNVLLWQRPSGCFGNINAREADAEESGKQTMRRPLMGKELQDGCESHITGVGTALLSIYLRYLLNGAPGTLINT